MSLFEHYPQELHDMDAQVRHYAAICGLDHQNETEIQAVVTDHAATGARATLRGLLILRMKVQAGMMEAGLTPGQ